MYYFGKLLTPRWEGGFSGHGQDDGTSIEGFVFLSKNRDHLGPLLRKERIEVTFLSYRNFVESELLSREPSLHHLSVIHEWHTACDKMHVWFCYMKLLMYWATPSMIMIEVKSLFLWLQFFSLERTVPAYQLYTVFVPPWVRSSRTCRPRLLSLVNFTGVRGSLVEGLHFTVDSSLHRTPLTTFRPTGSHPGSELRVEGGSGRTEYVQCRWGDRSSVLVPVMAWTVGLECPDDNASHTQRYTL